MSALRPIRPLDLPEVTPAPALVDAPLPRFEMADPATLWIDDVYQRSLSERSIRLIRKIVSEWSWSRFNPPKVVMVEGRRHVLDGQHTAIAAASHPEISEIPIMLVEAPELLDRARAFIGHNRDRVAVTPVQLFHAAVAAGDPDEMTVAQVCERAGARVLRVPPAGASYAVGDTLAVTTLRTICNRLGAMRARMVVQCLVDAKCAPLSADLLKAAAEILHGADYAGEVDAADLATAIRSLGPKAEHEAAQMAAAKRVPRWRALTIVLFRNARKRHGSRGAA